MFKKLLNVLNVERMTAVGTWAVVAASACYFMSNNDEVSWQRLLLVILLYIVFIILWLFTTVDDPRSVRPRFSPLLIALQYALIIALYFTVPYTYTAILVTLWCTQLPHYIPMRLAFLTSPLWSVPLWIIYAAFWHYQHMFVSALLFWMFNLFALVMINTTINERKARESANQLNRELLATQSLLSQATKQAERVRIARNIHDLLGHHLTALTINLQVAERISQGEAKSKIEQCHSLAKLLLTDVREAVSEIRERSSLQLQSALHALIDDIPNLNVQLNYDAKLEINDVMVAETILRCVQESLTNSLKHGKADCFMIDLNRQGHRLSLTLRDNGKPASQFTEGNGLLGIKERVFALGGQVFFQATGLGFVTQLNFPESK
jgi:two-component system, NarL family, sensor histidine kinase DesK